VAPLMMVGGAFLCYEGFEKLIHVFARHKADDDSHREELAKALADPAVDLVALERDKIKGAVRTDFILSAEIIVISLGTVASAALPQRIAALIGIALLMTVGVYGLVAGIVKLDDGGLHLLRRTGTSLFARAQRAFGAGILRVAPWLMKGLAVAGTTAMFLVGGGIISHGIPPLHHIAGSLPGGLLVSLLFDALTGIAAGALVVVAVLSVQRLRPAVA
jgi:predicted DNA repair protein MutK